LEGKGEKNVLRRGGWILKEKTGAVFPTKEVRDREKERAPSRWPGNGKEKQGMTVGTRGRKRNAVLLLLGKKLGVAERDQKSTDSLASGETRGVGKNNGGAREGRQVSTKFGKRVAAAIASRR